MNFDDINFDYMGKDRVSIPVNDVRELFKQTYLKTLENRAMLNVILTFQLELMNSQMGIPLDELNDKQKELYEKYLATEVAEASKKI